MYRALGKHVGELTLAAALLAVGCTVQELQGTVRNVNRRTDGSRWTSTAR